MCVCASDLQLCLCLCICMNVGDMCINGGGGWVGFCVSVCAGDKDLANQPGLADR